MIDEPSGVEGTSKWSFFRGAGVLGASAAASAAAAAVAEPASSVGVGDGVASGSPSFGCCNIVHEQ